jgi:hypothetical protein
VGHGGTTGPVVVAVGGHTVGESAGTGTTLADYDTTIDCGGAVAGTSTAVSLAAGDEKTCTVSNARKRLISVNKVLVPAGDPGLFNLQIDGATAGTGADVGNGGNTGPVPVTVGGHTVGETAGTGTNLANYLVSIGGDCNDQGQVTLAAGESKTCVITNTRLGQRNGDATLVVIKHVVTSGPTTAADFTMTVSGTAVPGGSTSFPGAEAPGTTLTLTPGTYTVTEAGPSGFVQSLSGDCTNVTIAAGQTRTCAVTNTEVRPAPPNLCSKSSVTSVLNPSSGRFRNNAGLDHLVRVDLGESIQAAVDSAMDDNGDGYILIGVIAGPGTPGPYGGHTQQRVTISEQYEKPFALIGCSVTMHDPDLGDGLPTGLIAASASSPTSPTNPASIFVMDLHGADSEVAGWKVEGSKRELRSVNTSGNAVGLWIVGDGNTVVGGATQDNLGDGISIQGDGNVVNGADSMGNAGHGVRVAGDGNQLIKVDAGDLGKGNGGDGVNASGDGNELSEVRAYANAGGGVAATGSGNQILKSLAGDKAKGNGGDGIHVIGPGNLVQESKAAANGADGLNVSGGTQAAPNRLRSNQSNQSNPGAAGSLTENVAAEYRLRDYVTNFGGGNKADNVLVPKGTSPVKCPTFPAANTTVNAVSEIVCD